VLLGKRTANRLLRRLSDERLRRRVDDLLERFRASFPEIQYDVLWDSRTCNAQAFVSDGRRCVRLYGGLARHRRMTVAGLAWVLAHETGHHLGGAPFHLRFPWISSEDRANSWAATIGLPRVFGGRLAQRYCKLGRREATRSVA